MHKPSFQHFSDRAECLQQLAAVIVMQLQQTLAEQSTASLLLPGGDSPLGLLPLLVAQPLPWAQCNLCPTDERWVPVDDPQSNLLLLQRGLPAARCLDPRLCDTPEQSVSAWGAALQAWLPFSAVLLGMGEDGHFASLFPNMPGLEQALDVAQLPGALVGLAPDQPQTRVSLNLSMLVSTRWLGLLASGGSTNHTLHLPAIARAAGYELQWEDFAELSKVVPLLARVYPNGAADVNQFQAAGGPAWLLRELLSGGLLHADALTVAEAGLTAYTQEAWLDQGRLAWRQLPTQSAAPEIVRTLESPFSTQGGLCLLEGNLGRAIIKTSALPAAALLVRAQARIFDNEAAVQQAYAAKELQGDLVLVLRFQGPRANGMPELHKLMPLLTNLQQAGQRVALLTDGRLSGASGQVPAALHLTPEAALGGPLAFLQEGDWIELDALAGVLRVERDVAEWSSRQPAIAPAETAAGYGLHLFAQHRRQVGPADQGATTLDWED